MLVVTDASMNRVGATPGARAPSKRALKVARDERRTQEKIDAILAKVHAKGMNSLTWFERRALRLATERQRGR